jgi:hypothetical protein
MGKSDTTREEIRDTIFPEQKRPVEKYARCGLRFPFLHPGLSRKSPQKPYFPY